MGKLDFVSLVISVNHNNNANIASAKVGFRQIFIQDYPIKFVDHGSSLSIDKRSLNAESFRHSG